MLIEEGLPNVFARHHRLAGAVRAAVDAWGLRICAQGPEWFSDTVTAIVVPDGFDANDVIKTAYNRYDLSLGSGLNKVAGKVFRIGHLGWLNEIMILQALGGASWRCAMSASSSSRAPAPAQPSAICRNRERRCGSPPSERSRRLRTQR